jgi:hypothetical protein
MSYANEARVLLSFPKLKAVNHVRFNPDGAHPLPGCVLLQRCLREYASHESVRLGS